MEEKDRIVIEEAVNRALENGATPEEVQTEFEYALENYES
jgi:hypothetical protein